MEIIFRILNKRAETDRVLKEEWKFKELPRKGDRIFSEIEDDGFEVDLISWNNRDKIITIWLNE